ncbi:hypothetical protein [Butyricimonas sp. Marseille-P3923]|uniref:hypothetical protein n=1 Tax=Butyricimonas TaxID=574697 RepID=UPI0011454669|nr:hypothetical protein [Butyricimonas sp. Marseille-P3923]
MKRILLIFLVILWFTSCQESLLEDSISEVSTESELNLLRPSGTKYYAIIAPTSPLTPMQKQYLLECLYSLEMKYPELDAVISNIMQNRGALMFKMNSKLSSYAAYDFSSIEFQSDIFIEDELVLEEILHVAQDINYGYEVMRYATKNIEFEARVLRDIWELRRAQREHSPTWYPRAFEKFGEYNAWLVSLSCGNLFFLGVPKFNEYVQKWNDPLYERYNLPFYPDFNPSFLKSFVGDSL